MIRTAAVVLALGTGLALAPAPAPAQEAQEATDLLLSLIRLRSPGIENVAARPEIVAAVVAQNGWGLEAAEIAKRDREWQAAEGVTPFMESLQTNEAGRFLRGVVERGNKTYTEALLMDRAGALVAAFPPPSDYAQGDEEKFQEPFRSGQLYIGPIHFDHSTQAYVSDGCAPVFADGKDPVGVLCMAVRLSKGPGIPPERTYE